MTNATEQQKEMHSFGRDYVLDMDSIVPRKALLKENSVCCDKTIRGDIKHMSLTGQNINCAKLSISLHICMEASISYNLKQLP